LGSLLFTSFPLRFFDGSFLEGFTSCFFGLSGFCLVFLGLIESFLEIVLFKAFKAYIENGFYISRIVKKYADEYSFPILSNGCSTVFAPIQVRIMRIERSVHSFIFFVVLNFVDFDFFITSVIRIKIDDASANTPPSFDGRDRRITYMNREYHSG